MTLQQAINKSLGKQMKMLLVQTIDAFELIFNQAKITQNSSNLKDNA